MSNYYNATIPAVVFLIFNFTLSYSQLSDGHLEKNIEYALFKSDSINSFESYKEINKFNKQNSRYLKSPQTFKLDSVIGKSNDRTSKSTILLSDTLEVSFSQKLEDDQWLPQSFTAFHYNKNGLVTKQTFNPWDGDNFEVNESLATVIRKYSYNNEGLLEIYQDFNANDIANDKYSNLNYLYYDSLNRLDSIEYTFWYNFNDTSIIVEKSYYSYNEKDQLSESISFEYDFNGILNGGDSIRYFYNEDGLLTKEDLFFFRDSLDNFKAEAIREYKYNSNQSIDKIIFYVKENNEFNLSSESRYLYHSYGDLKAVTLYKTNSFGQLIPNMKEEFTHNENISKEEIILYRDYERRIPDNQIQNSMLINRKEYSFDSFLGDWSLSVEQDFYYSDITTSTAELVLPLSRLKLYPNPAFDRLNIDIDYISKNSVIKIWDISGQLVYNESLSSNSSVDISHLSQGLYFCNLYSDNEVWQGRFVKK